MPDQPSSSPTPDDIQGQPREDASAMDRWLAQHPRQDGVLTVNLRATQGTFTEGTRSGGQARDDDISVDSNHNVAGYQVTSEKNSPLENRIPPYQHQNTQGDCGQPSSNAHDTSQPENFLEHQHQEHLIPVLLPFPGQETWGQPFDQVSMPLGLPGTSDYSRTSYGAIQLNNEVYQLSDPPDPTFFQGITYDRRCALQQLYGEVQQELSTFGNASRSLQPFAPEHWEFNSYLYPFQGYSVDGTSVTHTTGNFGRLGTNQPRGCTPPHHLNLPLSQLSTYPSLIEPWRSGSMTTPSYPSDTHSRAMDEVFSEMTLSTAPTTDISLPHNNSRPYNLDTAHVLHSNPANHGKPISDSSEAQKQGTEGPTKQATRRITPRQYVETGRIAKTRRVVKTDGDGHNVYAYSCPFYLKNSLDYWEGKWGICAKNHWTNYQRMREHLFRKHKRPVILCENCFEGFKDDDSLREHIESQCERKAHSPYLSTEQQSQLEQRIKGGMKEAEKMEQMYRIFSINGAFLSPERSRQIRLKMEIRSALAAYLIPPGDIERITNDALQVIQRASSTVRIELEHNPQGCDGFENALAVSSGITEHAPTDIEHNGDNRLLHLGN
ncbi:hypothetical protein J3E69DRAFT_324446 [Trichoderma sp. SZMC 28015]